MKSPKTIISLLAIMFIVSMVAFIRSANKNEALQRDLDRMTQNVANVNYEVQFDKVQDSLPVAQTNALQVKYDELKKLHLTDTQLIKDLKVRLKDAQTIHTVSSATTDTVPISPVPNTADSVFSYSDRWLQLHIDLPARLCQYTAYDSLTTIVSRTYKHKFLWWRWGTKGYQVQIVNFNPHAKVRYSKFINISK